MVLYWTKFEFFPGAIDRCKITVAVFIPHRSSMGHGPLAGYGLDYPMDLPCSTNNMASCLLCSTVALSIAHRVYRLAR